MSRKPSPAGYAIDTVRRHFPRLSREYVGGRLRHSTFVSVKHRYLYFEVPKAACSALKDLVRRVEACPEIPKNAFIIGRETRRDMGIHVRDCVPVPSLIDLDDDVQQEVLESPSYLRLLVVRNPYDRLVSAWRNKVLVCEPGFEYVHKSILGAIPSADDKSFIPFADFVAFVGREDLGTCNPHWRLQTAHAFVPAISYSFVGHIENLADALAVFQRHLGPEIALRTKATNVSGFQKDPCITPELTDKIYGLYRDDFDSFGYGRESWRSNKPPGSVPEAAFYDEVIERNIVISSLYEEIERLTHDRVGLHWPRIRRLRGRISLMLGKTRDFD